MKFNFQRWSDCLYQFNSISELDKLDLSKLSAGVFQLNDLSSILNFYVKNFDRIKNKPSKKLLVGFGGALSSRDPNTAGPFFSFMNIASDLDIPLLSFSDSSLYLDQDIKLSWYTGGTTYRKQQLRIAQVIETICKRYGLEPILCGGSGGGFASLAISTFLKIEHGCLVWNPQTSIQKYFNRYVNDYIKICYPNFKSKSRVTQFNQIDKYGIVHDVTVKPINKKMKLVYLQNITDEFHVTSHCLPFVKEQGFIEEQCENEVFKYFKDQKQLILGCNWGKGHIPPNKDLLLFVLDALNNNMNLDKLSDDYIYRVNMLG